MPRIRNWLKEVVHNPDYKHHIWWEDEGSGLIAIHWKHGSYDDYADQDSALFKKWAVDNNRYDPWAADSRDERKRWKTNFRNALHSATNIRTRSERLPNKNDKDAFRVYELLDTPDPRKVDQKKRSNVEAAKSKRKPSSQKRVYNSRLNKPAAKDEPKKSRHQTRKSKGQMRPTPYSMPHDNVSSDSDLGISLSPVHREESCESFYFAGVPPPPEELPTTINDFNNEDEGDDGGYHSSDSLSVNSADSNTNALIPDRELTTDLVADNYLHLPYSVGPLPNIQEPLPMAVGDFDESPPCDLNNNVYFSHNARAYEISNTANASTEVYMNPEYYDLEYASQPEDGYTPYSYTVL